MGGLMGMFSRLALALVGAAVMLFGAAQVPAKAADFGGGCCGDLEERIAELEATSARKGNRVVSLQVYGQVNKALMYFDDSVKKDVFIVDNNTDGSRFGISGRATLRPGLVAGYIMEFDVQDAASDQVSNVGKNGDDPADRFAIRLNDFFLDSDKLGRISIGKGSTAADGASTVIIVNSQRNSSFDDGNSLSIRNKSGGFTGLQMKDYASNFDGRKLGVIRYDSPAILGFVASATWGQNDYADVGLRWSQTLFDAIRVSAAVAYQWDNNQDINNSETVNGSFSLSHIPTGLFASFSAGRTEFKDVREGQDSSFWYTQGGIERKWLPYGSTTIYGEYGNYDSVTFEGATTERWGFGVTQRVDSAALDIYAQATFMSFDDPINNAADTSTVLVGSKIVF
jgi:hypothetical protein